MRMKIDDSGQDRAVARFEQPFSRLDFVPFADSGNDTVADVQAGGADAAIQNDASPANYRRGFEIEFRSH